MRRALLSLAILTLSLLAVPPSQAQAAVGPLVLYAKSLPAAGGAVDLVLEAPDGADGTASCIPLCPDTFELTATSAGLPAAVVATEATVEAVAWFKSWNNAPSPGVEVTFSLLVDGTEVASGSKSADVMNNAIVEFRVSMPYTGPATLPAGTVVTWVVGMVNGACDCYPGTGYARGVSSDHPWSVSLPGAFAGAGPAAPVLETLEGAAVNMTRAFDNETTGTYVFNWTGPATPLLLAALANGTGNATLAIVDAANRTLAAANLTAVAATATINGTAGNWSITLGLDAFRGNVSILLAAPSATSASSPTPGATSLAPAEADASPGDDGNRTAVAAPEEAPAPTLVVLLASLALAAVAARRRR